MSEASPTSQRKKRQRRTPFVGYDARTAAPFGTEVGSVAVPDPYSDTGAKQLMSVALRTDPLGRLYARRQIDDAQYRAGRALQEQFEVAESTIRGVDPSNEPVDGRGQFPELITDRNLRAYDGIKFARDKLGDTGFWLCQRVLAERRSMESVAAEAGSSSQRSIDYWARRFREALQTMAIATGARGVRSAHRDHSWRAPTKES